MKLSALETISAWFQKKNWQPQRFQMEAWQAYFQRKSGLILAPTGSGKSFAALLGPLSELQVSGGLQLLYLSPLRALTRDLHQNLSSWIEEHQLHLRAEMRTGDTSSYRKRKQTKVAPDILLTTPESLNLMFTDPGHRDFFKNLRCVVVDEWHELVGNKRGLQTSLSIAHLQSFLPQLQIWGLSATLANPEASARALLGSSPAFKIIQSPAKRAVEIESILPSRLFDLPWAGHSGLSLLPFLLPRLDLSKTQLLFTNTRSQAELWYHALLEAKPEWKDILAIHHGSLSMEERQEVEERIRSGECRVVVCTSTLDLGVDFPSVDQVVQIGSVKSISRLIQRAGRSRHRPGAASKILILPTHAFQILEIAAARRKINQPESPKPPRASNDVLAQHLLNLAIGEGFRRETILQEIRMAYAYRDYDEKLLNDLIEFLTKGGRSLETYPQYKKIHLCEDGLYRLEDRRLIHLHKLNSGTIVSDAYMDIILMSGKRLGQMEESFLTKLKPGDAFLFGGRNLILVRFKELKAYVKLASSRKKSELSVWYGGQLPVSDRLALGIRELLSSNEDHPEKTFEEDLLRIQNKISAVPKDSECLFEILSSSEGKHLFVYPFEGVLVHQGLGALLSLRMSKKRKSSLSITCNDYGLEILAAKDYPFEEDLSPELFSHERLLEEIPEAINLSEISRRQFRGIAQIAGLIYRQYPGQMKMARQLQASSGLIYDVLAEYEPEHILLQEARRESLQDQFELERLRNCLQRLQSSRFLIKHLNRFSPFSLPVSLDRQIGRISSESLDERIRKIQNSWTS